MNSEQVMGMIRHALTIAGGFFVAQGLLTDGALTEIVGGIMAFVGASWSWWVKRDAPAELPPPAEAPPSE